MALLTRPAPAAPAAPERLGYLATLDGLRALAAVAVVAYHVESGPLPGGFLGVDVFFVLSGFLITRLLLEERAGTGRVDLRRFWSRRARRLLPALAVVVAAACAWSWVAQGAVARRQTAGDAVASLLYVANWRFVQESASYFAPLVEASPLRHLWSLAVEEQWYLVWPLVVVLVLRRAGPRALAVVCAAGALASAAWMAVLATTDLDRAYYGTDSRAQALLVGALLACVTVAWPRVADRVGGCGGNRVGLVSLAALAALAWAVSADDAWLYRGGFLLAALAAAGLVAWLAFGLPSAVHRAFAHPTTVWMGKRSYALYVWHWPVVVALTPEVAGFGGARLGMVQAALAVALAAASYRLVEEPVRIGLPARRGLLATGAVSGAAAVLAVGLLASGTALPAARPGAVLSLEAAAASPAPAPSAQPSPAPRAEPAKPPPLRVLLLGDSQAYVVADDTARWALAPGVDLSAWATIGCGIGSAPVVSAGVQLPYPGAACDEWAEAWRDKATVARPDVVVVQLGAWEVTDVLVAGQVLAFGTPEHDAWLLERLRMAFAAAGASGAPVVALDVPCYAARPGAFTVAAERNDPARVAHLNALVAQVAAEHGAVVAAQDHFACEGDVERRLPTGAELRYDGVHYTRDGVAAFWAWLTPLLHDVAGRTDQRRPAVAAQ